MDFGQVAYVSFMKRAIRMQTTALYMQPIPYAHLQVCRVTSKPKANGERNEEMMNPIVQMLS